MSAEATAARVLIVDDEASVRVLVAEVMRRAGHAVQQVDRGDLAVQTLDREAFDLVLLDLSLPGIAGMEVLATGRGMQPDAQFVVMTGHATVSSAVQAMRLGAFDYLAKPVDVDELALIAERALAEGELRREVSRLRAADGGGVRAQLVGGSAPMRRLWDLVQRVAPTTSTVLVTGETGTGKELVARAVHELSGRARRPFVPVHCGALADSLLESELFGHVKGAFTGAVASRRGVFEEAHGGTLFLDEVGAIPPATQVRLLRVLQERMVQRVGSSTAVPVDFRLVAAGNVELAREVAEGRFREDLFYRLNVFPIRVPPLRERRDDIPALVDHFRLRYARQAGGDPPRIAPETLSRMQAYDWPGNVRELEHFMERAMILNAGSATIAWSGTSPTPAAGPPRPTVPAAPDGDDDWTLERVEREHILGVLERMRGNRLQAALRLGMDRRTLHRKLRAYQEEGIHVPPGE